MSAPTKATDSPLKSPTGAESPTTARPLEMDDDDVQDSGTLGRNAPAPSKHATVEDEDEAPAKPPRPLSPRQQAETTLKEAFPSIDAAVVKAVLMASGGRVEPAFNALLGMSDPDAVREPTPPPQPPRPAAPRSGSTLQSQVEADEQYARQLAEHYGGDWVGDAPRNSSRGDGPRKQQAGQGPGPTDPARERSFIDDDLPIIGENLKKGFLETQSKLNGWINTLKKRIDGEDDDDVPYQGHNNGRASDINYIPRRNNDGRRSGEYNRYDADPQVLSDDFAGMQMNSDGTPARRSTRPLANPDLFKPTPPTPKAADSRKVSFQGGPSEEIDLYRASPRVGAKENTPPPASKSSKWQPLSTVDPKPVGESENDPFSLGDSDDEKESKDRVGGKEVRTDDATRLKKAAAEAMNDSISEPTRKPEAAETTGTRDKVADEKLSGK